MTGAPQLLDPIATTAEAGVQGTPTRSRVCLLQRVLPHYRLPFLLRAHALLREAGVDLSVYFGQERTGERPQSVADPGHPWIHRQTNGYLPVFGAVWQKLPREVLDADLVIVEQANRLLANYRLLARRRLLRRPGRLAFWTHGRNWQCDPSSLRERWKRCFTRGVDYWFCYTDQVADYLAEVPAESKCSIDNAIDTTQLMAAIADCRRSGSAKDEAHLLFVGSMRVDKRLDWVFHAMLAAHAGHPEVTAGFLGDGPEAGTVREFCARHPWAVYHGPAHGAAIAPHLLRATAILSPGLVGLVVLDAFAGAAPLITTPFGGRHSPEFHYARDGSSMLVTGDDKDSFAAGVSRFLRDGLLRERLRDGCRQLARTYTIDNMARRFANGVVEALSPRGLI